MSEEPPVHLAMSPQFTSPFSASKQSSLLALSFGEDLSPLPESWVIFANLLMCWVEVPVPVDRSNLAGDSHLLDREQPRFIHVYGADLRSGSGASVPSRAVKASSFSSFLEEARKEVCVEGETPLFAAPLKPSLSFSDAHLLDNVINRPLTKEEQAEYKRRRRNSLNQFIEQHLQT